MPNRIREVLNEQGKTPYWLYLNSSISLKTAYNVTAADGPDLDRMQYGTVVAIARALKVRPGTLKARKK